MRLTMLKAKLHRACVTHSEPDYEGSCAIDSELLACAGIHEYEQIHLYNVTNGERLVTYAIRAAPGSRIVSVNGAAARRASPGDRVILCAYADMNSTEVAEFKPRLVYLDEQNRIIRIGDSIPAQNA